MITPTVKTGQPLLIATKVGINKFIFEYQVASTKYQVGKETRAKSREARTESQETRAKRRETRCPGAVRFLCVSAPLRAKRRKEKRDKGLEPRAKKQEARVVRSLISLRLPSAGRPSRLCAQK
jgi:hypothetical protein